MAIVVSGLVDVERAADVRPEREEMDAEVAVIAVLVVHVGGNADVLSVAHVEIEDGASQDGERVAEQAWVVVVEHAVAVARNRRIVRDPDPFVGRAIHVDEGERELAVIGRDRSAVTRAVDVETIERQPQVL